MEAMVNPWDMLYLLHEHVTLVQLPTMLTLGWVILTSNLFLDVSNVSRCGTRLVTISTKETVMFTVVACHTQLVAIRLFLCSQAKARESRPAEMAPSWVSPLTCSPGTRPCRWRCRYSPGKVCGTPSRASLQLWPPPLCFSVIMDSDEARVHGEYDYGIRS
jgi:hypothetical protein